MCHFRATIPQSCCSPPQSHLEFPRVFSLSPKFGAPSSKIVGNLPSTPSPNSIPFTTLPILGSYRFGSSCVSVIAPVPCSEIGLGHTWSVHQRPQDHGEHPQHEHVRRETIDSYQQRVFHHDQFPASASRFHKSLARFETGLSSLGFPLAVSRVRRFECQDLPPRLQ